MWKKIFSEVLNLIKLDTDVRQRKTLTRQLPQYQKTIPYFVKVSTLYLLKNNNNFISYKP